MSQLKKAYLLKDGEVRIQFVGEPPRTCSDPTLLFSPNLETFKAFPNETYDKDQIAAVSEALEEASKLRDEQKPKIEIYGKYDGFYEAPRILTRVTFPAEFVNKLKNVLADAKISIRGTYNVVGEQPQQNRSNVQSSAVRHNNAYLYKAAYRQANLPPLPAANQPEVFSVDGIRLKEHATYETFNGSGKMSELYKSQGLKHAQLNFSIIIEWQDFGLDSEEREQNVLGKLLQDKSLADCTIVVSKTKEFQCHRSILAVHSDVLRANLESGMKESQCRRIEMNDVSADAVKLMLDFMYCKKLQLEGFNVDVVVDLLKTAHKYNIGQLEKLTTQFLSRQTTDWFTVNGAFELYLFTMNVDSSQTLTGKLRSIMRANPQQLSSCSTFKEWVSKDPNAAVQFSLMLGEPETETMNPPDNPEVQEVVGSNEVLAKFFNKLVTRG